MSKKLLYTILAGALSISVLGACGDASDDPDLTDDPAIEEPVEAPAN